MTISFSGLASGLDTSSWVESLVALKQAKVTALEEEKESVLLSRETLDNIKAFFNSFRSVLEKVTDAKFSNPTTDLFAQNLAKSSNLDILTATATTEAEEAKYNVLVDKLASNTEVNSNYRYTTTIIQTTTATCDSKLSSLGVKAGNIGVTVNGIERGISITNNDTIGTFIDKLQNIGVEASYNDTTGIFSINVSSGAIREIDPLNPTGIVEALHLSGVNEGYTSNTLKVSATETMYSAATEDTKLSELGISEGTITVQANGTEYSITIGVDSTLRTFVDDLRSNSIDASYDELTGIFTLQDATIISEGSTHIIEKLGLDIDIYSKSQQSGSLKYEQTITETVNATYGTAIKDLGTGVSIPSDATVVVKNSNNEYTTINITDTSTLGSLLTDMNNAGLYARINGDGRIEITGGEIVTGAEGGNFDIQSILGLQSEPYNAMVTGSILSETVVVQEKVTLDTRLVDDLRVTEGYIGFTDSEGNNQYLKIYSGQTISNLMSDLAQFGIYTDFDAREGILYITGGHFSTLTDTTVAWLMEDVRELPNEDRYKHGSNLLECLFGSPAISPLHTQVASTYARTKALTYSVTRQVDATADTVLGSICTTLTDGTAEFTVRDEATPRTINITSTTTIEDLMEELANVGIASSWDSDHSRLHIENARLTGGTSHLEDVLNLTETISGKYVTSDELYTYKTTSIDATGETALIRYGVLDSMSDSDRTVNLYDSNGSLLNSTIVTEATSIDDLLAFINAETDVSANIIDGILTINNGYIENAVLETGMGLSKSNSSSYVLGSIITVTTSASVTKDTTLENIIETLGTEHFVEDEYTLYFNSQSISVSAGTTVDEIISQIYAHGGTAILDSTGRLSINGGTLTGTVADALGIISITNTASVSATGGTLKAEQTVYANRDTKLSDLGIADTDFTIYNNLNQAVTVINVSTSDTLGDIFDILNSNGIDAIIADGVIKLHSPEGKYIAGALADSLNITAQSVVDTVNTSQSSTVGITHTGTVFADLTTTLGTIGAITTDGEDFCIYDKNQVCIATISNLTTESTIEDLFNELRRFNIDASIVNGVISLYSRVGNYADGTIIQNLGITVENGENASFNVANTISSTVQITFTDVVTATSHSKVNEFLGQSSQSYGLMSVITVQTSPVSGYTWVTTADELQDAILANQNIMLGADIDMNELSSAWQISDSYSKILDGNGHTIKNLTINSTDKKNVGLLGYMTAGAKVCNLKMENVNITVNKDTDAANVGAVVGFADIYATIENVSVLSGRINVKSESVGGVGGDAELSVGGIAGSASDSRLTLVYNGADIYAESENEKAFAGGICGKSDKSGNINDVYNKGNIHASGSNAYAGGIFGLLQAGAGSGAVNKTLTNAFNSGSVHANSPSMSYSGGIAGAIYNPSRAKVSNAINISTDITSIGAGTNCINGIGYVSADSPEEFENCYYDNSTGITNNGTNGNASVGIVSGSEELTGSTIGIKTLVDFVPGLTIYDSYGTRIGGIIVNTDTTFDDIFTQLAAYDISASISGGVITLSSLHGNYVTGDVADILGIGVLDTATATNITGALVTSTLSVTYTENVVATSNSGINKFTTESFGLMSVVQIRTTALEGYTWVTTADELQAAITADENIMLGADIDMNELSSAWQIRNYSAIFDGNGHSISNFHVEADVQSVGLIGYLNSGGVVKNLKMDNVSVRNTHTVASAHESHTGAVVGFIREGASLENVSVISGDIYQDAVTISHVGGITGVLCGNSKNVYNAANVNVKTDNISATYTGGIAGVARNTHENINNAGNINIYYETNDSNLTNASVGGVFGALSEAADLTKACNSGTIDVSVEHSIATNVGGVTGAISNSAAQAKYLYNEGSVHVTAANSSNVAGIVGNTNISISDSINTSSDIVLQTPLSRTAKGAVGIKKPTATISNTYYDNTFLTDAYATGVATGSSELSSASIGMENVVNFEPNLSIYNQSGTKIGEIIVSSGTTFDDIFTQLAAYDISGSINNGVVSLTSLSGNYVVGQVADVLGIGTVVGDGSTATIGTAATSTFSITYTESVVATMNSKISDFIHISNLTQEAAEAAGYTWVTTAEGLQNALLAGDKICLGSDINLSGVSWVSVENYNNTFDGNGYKIKNLDILVTDHSGNFGLIGSTADGAYIKNVILENASVKCKVEALDAYVGGVVGYASEGTTIENVSVLSGSIEGREYAGGVVGYNNGTITKAYNAAEIWGYNDSNNCNIGGIAGYSATLLSSVCNTGKINIINQNTLTSSCKVYAGGIVGYGNVTNGYNTGDIEGSNGPTQRFSAYIGGITGYGSSVAEISSVYNTGAVCNRMLADGSFYVAGIAGYAEQNISSAYNAGQVNSKLSGSAAFVGEGGIAGQCTKSINSVCNTALIDVQVMAQGSFSTIVGGICGNVNVITSAANAGNVSYNAVNTSVGGTFIGGVFGYGSVETSNNAYLRNSGDLIIGNCGALDAGGIGGQSSSVVGYTYNTGNISIQNTSGCRVGGIIGSQYNQSLHNGYNTGNINITNAGAVTAGGLVGLASSFVMTSMLSTATEITVLNPPVNCEANAGMGSTSYLSAIDSYYDSACNASDDTLTGVSAGSPYLNPDLYIWTFADPQEPSIGIDNFIDNDSTISIFDVYGNKIGAIDINDDTTFQELASQLAAYDIQCSMSDGELSLTSGCGNYINGNIASNLGICVEENPDYRITHGVLTTSTLSVTYTESIIATSRSKVSDVTDESFGLMSVVQIRTTALEGYTWVTTADELQAAITADENIMLGADIDMNELSSDWQIRNYSAIFDGNGHAIRNFTSSTGGLINNLRGTVKNLKMENVDITAARSQCGAIANCINDSNVVIDNVSVISGSIICSSSTDGVSVGGIVGYVGYMVSINTTINNVYNGANIIGNSETAIVSAGGICGFNKSETITNAVNTGNISASSNLNAISNNHTYVGGIAGVSHDNSKIENAYNSGSLYSFASVNKSHTSGIAGYSSNAEISNAINVSTDLVAETDSGMSFVKGISHGGTMTFSNCYYDNSTGLNNYKTDSSFETAGTTGVASNAVELTGSTIGIENLANFNAARGFEIYNNLGAKIGEIIVSSDTTFDDIFTQLAAYDISGSINNGVVSLTSLSGNYVTGQVADVLGIGTEEGDGVTRVSGTHVESSSAITYTENVFATGSSKLSDFVTINYIDQVQAENDGYTWVTTADELQAALLNKEKICLGADIDMDTLSDTWEIVQGYNNIFEGNGHTIKNLNVVSGEDYIGFIGSTASGAVIRNVNFENLYVEGDGDYVGGVVGLVSAGTVIDHVAVLSGEVTSTNYGVGGIAGCNEGTITNVYNAANVSGYVVVGGIVGSMGLNSSVTNAYNVGNIYGEEDVGGIAGLIEYSGVTISNSYNSGNITANGENVGGIVGENDYDTHSVIITSCVNSTGNIVSLSSANYCYGICGRRASATISNCYFDNSTGLTDPRATGLAPGSPELEASSVVNLNNLTASNGINIFDRDGNLIHTINLTQDTTFDNLIAQLAAYDVTASLTNGQLSLTSEVGNYVSGDVIEQLGIVTVSEPSRNKTIGISTTSTTRVTYTESIIATSRSKVSDVTDESFGLMSVVQIRTTALEGYTWVTTADELQAAITANENIMLGADIDMNELSSAWQIRNYSAIFDGNGHAIRNFTSSTGGLINNLRGTVKNLKMENVDITAARSQCGAIAKYINDSNVVIDNVSVISGSIICSSSTDEVSVGGIVGYVGYMASINTTINNVYNGANIIGNSETSSVSAGGICGFNKSETITNAVNTGNISGSSNSNASGKHAYVGGIVGVNHDNSKIENAYNSGSLYSFASVNKSHTSGIAGYSQNAEISNAINVSTDLVAETDSGSSFVKGISHSSTATFSNCYYDNSTGLNNYKTDSSLESTGTNGVASNAVELTGSTIGIENLANFNAARGLEIYNNLGAKIGEIIVSSDTTFDDIFTQLAAYDISGSINNGVVSLTSLSGNYVTGQVADILGIATENNGSGTVNTNSDRQSIDIERTISSDTMFRKLGMDSDASIVINHNGVEYTVSVLVDQTVQEFFTSLSAYGISCSIGNDKKIILTGQSDSYITSIDTDLADALNIDENGYFYRVAYGKANTASETQTALLETTLSMNTTFAQLGLSSDGEIGVNYEGVDYTVTVHAGQTVGDLLTTLAGLGVSGSIDSDGKLHLQGTLNGRITAINSDVASALGLSTDISDYSTEITSTGTVNTNSDRQSIDIERTISGDTIFSQLGLTSDGLIRVNYEGVDYTVTVHAGQTVGDLLTTLAGFGISGAIDSSGKLNLQGTTNGYIVSIDLDLANVLNLSHDSGDYSSVTTGKINTNSNTQTALLESTINLDSTFEQIGLTENGTIDVNYEGIDYTITVRTDQTVGEILIALAGYGISGTISQDGKLTLQGTRDGYIFNISDGVKDVLGLNVGLNNTYITSDLTYTYNTNSDRQEYNSIENVKADSTFAKLGLNSDGEIGVNYEGVDYIVTVHAGQTVGEIFTALAGLGISGAIDSDGKINLQGTVDGHITSISTELADILHLSTDANDYIDITTTTTKVNTTSDVQSQIIESSLRTDTTFAKLHLAETGYITVVSNGTEYVVTVTSEKTVDDIISTIAGYGISASVEDGRITFVAQNGCYIKDMSDSVKEALRIEAGYDYSWTTTTGNTWVNTNSDIQEYEKDDIILTGDTVISSINGYNEGNGSLIVHQTDGTFVTISVDSSNTIDEFFNQISVYGLVGSVDSDGKITITGVGNVYLQEAVGGSNILSALKLSNLVSNVRTVTVNRTSAVQAQTVTTAATGTTTLENLEYADGTRIGFDSDDKAYIELDTYSDAGNQHVVLEFNKNSTIYDVISKLGEYGIRAQMDALGRFSIDSSTLNDFTVAGTLGTFLMGGTYTKQYGVDTTYNTSTNLMQTTVMHMNDNTLLSDLNITGGDIIVTQQGVDYTVNIDLSTLKDIGDFRNLIAQYGFESEIDNRGRLYIKNIGESYLSSTAGGSNILEKLGIDYDNWSLGTITQTSDYLSDSQTETTTIDMNVKLSQLTDASGNNLGITAGQIYVYKDGTRSLLNIDLNDTLQTLAAKLSQYEISIEISQDGKLYFDGNNNSYLTTEGIDSMNASNILAKLNISNNWLTRYDSTSDNLSYSVEQNEVVNGSTKIKDLQDSSGNNLGITDGSYYIYSSGVRREETINGDMTLNDLKGTLASYGLITDSNEDGSISIGAYNNTYMAASELAGLNTNLMSALFDEDWNFVNIYTTNDLEVPEDVVAAITRNTKLANINERTLLADGTYVPGYITIVKDGVQTNISLTADDTVGTLMDEIALYGFESVINERGQLIIRNTGNSLLQNYDGTGASNALELLGIDLTQWISTSSYESSTLNVITTTVSNVAGTRDTLLSTLEFEGATPEDRKITTGEYYIYNNGVKYTAMISSDETLGSLMDTLKSFGLETSLVIKDGYSQLTVIGNGDIYVAKSSSVNASNVVDKLFVTSSESKEYKGLEQTFTVSTTYSSASEDTLLSYYDNGVLNAEGDLCVNVNGVDSIIKISENETIGSFLNKLRDLGIEATLSDGQIIIQSGYNTFTINTDGTTSNLAATLGLSYSNDLGGYSSSDSVIESTTTIKEDKTLSAVNYANLDTKLNSLGISAIKRDEIQTLSVYRDGEKIVVNIDNDETFATLRTKLSAVYSDLDIKFEEGFLKFYSKTGNQVEVGASTDNTNFCAITGIASDGNGSSKSARELYTVNKDSLITAEGLFRGGNANYSSVLKDFEIATQTFKFKKDGMEISLNINENDTFGELRERLAGIDSDLELNLTEGLLSITSKSGATLTVDGANLSSNFATKTGLNNGENGLIGSKMLNQKVTEGKFIIGTAVFEIDSTTTLADIIAQINSSADANATAFWDSVAGKIVIKSRKSGAALVNIEAVTSNFTDILGYTTSEWNDLGTLEKTRLNVNNQAIGDNARISINGTYYTSTDNTITSEVTRIKGLTINLKGLTAGSAVTLTVEKDKETLANAVSEVVDSYNELMKNIDEEIAIGGKLHDQSTLKLIRNQLRNLMTGSDAGATIFRNLDAIGIRVEAASGNNISTKNIVNMSFDKDIFFKAFEADQTALKELLIGGHSNKGIFTKLEEQIELALAPVNGYFAATDNSYSKEIQKIDKKIIKANKDIERYRARLEAKFSAMDMLIAQMQQQYSTFLTN